MRNILALDLGTKTGWARYSFGVRTSGTWVLAKPDEIKANRAAGLDRNCDPRFGRLLTIIIDKLRGCDPDVPTMLVFEDVLFSETTLQTQLWSAFRSAVWASSITFGTEIKCLNTATLKKVSTGSGNATKQLMAVALQRRHPSLFSMPSSSRGGCMLLAKDNRKVDDNEVDANHLLDFFLNHE